MTKDRSQPEGNAPLVPKHCSCGALVGYGPEYTAEPRFCTPICATQDDGYFNEMWLAMGALTVCDLEQRQIGELFGGRDRQYVRMALQRVGAIPLSTPKAILEAAKKLEESEPAD